MAAEYGVYTLAEIYSQIFGSAPASASDLSMIRTYIKGLGGLPVSKTSNYFYYMPNDFFAKTAYSGSQALTVPGSTASSAWSAYTEAQGAVSQLTGGATQGGQLVKSAEIGYFRVPNAQSPSGYNYKPAALLSMELPTVAAAIAPIAGVALGATMYADNPELWTKLSQALIPWAYPDNVVEEGFVDINKGLMPVWTEVGEAAGELIARALLPAPLVDAFKDVLEEEGVGAEGEGYVPSGNPDGLPSFEFSHILTGTTTDGREIYNSSNAQLRWYNEGSTVTTVYWASPTPSPLIYQRRGSDVWNEAGADNFTYTKDGKTVYYGHANRSFYLNKSTASPSIPPYISPSLIGLSFWVMVYGNYVEQNYPIGTEKWGTGSVYPLPQNPTQIIFQNPDGTEVAIDAYPVPLPITPGQSTDPTIQGIDDPLVDISKQVDPYLQRTPDPYSVPSPTPENPNQPDPTKDPSQDGKPDGPISPDSPNPPPPPSDGQSPDPTPPIIPPPFTSEGGLIAVYNPPQSTLVAFANWLWVTYQDATIQKIWNNPFDGIISLHELYCTPPVIGTRSIKSGFLDSEIDSPIIGRYTEINCGSIVIPEYWGNYLDYAPYSKALVYLPFIGIIELEADDIVGHSVNILYRIDCYNGSCIALITVAKQGPDGEVYNNTVYQFSGNCAVELPLTGGSQANIKAAIINATAWGLGSVISGLVTAAGSGPIAGLAGAGQAISGALQATASVVNAKSSVQHSGTFGASFGAMGIKIPYIIVKRPIQVQVLNYNEIYGYQAHKAVTIGSCEGYLRCREVHVTSATANDEEKQLIEQYLKTGVIV